MTKKNDSQADESMANSGQAEIGADADQERTSGFTERLSNVIQPLLALGIEYADTVKGEFIRFNRSGGHPRHPDGTWIPIEAIENLAAQLAGQIVPHPKFKGFVNFKAKYAEIVIEGERFPHAPEYSSAVQINGLEPDSLPCVHDGADRRLPVLPSPALRADGLTDKRIHLTSPQGSGPCIELSNASPLAMLMFDNTLQAEAPLMLTAKFDYSEGFITESRIVQKTDELLRSLLYELDVRNARIQNAAPRPGLRLYWGANKPHSVTHKVRYPEIKIGPEVADLFNFAGQVSGNYPLVFLSFYQTLEYYFPSAARQNSLNQIRRELRDPSFDRDSDSCLLRVLSIAERLNRSSEPDQLKVLIREYVRLDRLEEFFQGDWSDHFTRRGPIQGVELINPANSSKILPDQVADRIYQIRNRIVHAKDDPRYVEAKVLLPRSEEAESLGPDVALARFLASEVIMANPTA